MIKNTTDADKVVVRGRPKDVGKAKKILDAASQLFLEKGFKGASMNEVAKVADVSKQTLYSHFAGKEALFEAVISNKVDDYTPPNLCQDLPDKLEHALNAIGKKVVGLISDPAAIGITRNIYGEGHSQKTISQLYFDNGPNRVISDLTRFLEAKGVENARFYAVAFINILEGEWYINALIGIQDLPSEKQIDAHVKVACKHFMKMLPQ